MSGVDTVRGIGYQHAHAVLTALEVLRDPQLGGIRVEGTADVLDIEVWDANGRMALAKQVKIRDSQYTWGKQELLSVMSRWSALNLGPRSSFEFVTDGRLGRTGEEVRTALTAASEGNTTPVASLLGVSAENPVCSILGRARIRQETSGVENVLAEAEREIRASLAGSFRRADLEQEARSCADRLFTLLSARAGHADPAVRFVKRSEIAAALGGFDRLALTDQWPGTLRDEYLRAAQEARFDAIEPRLTSFQPRFLDEEAAGESVRILLDGREPKLVVGPTGSGKTTASQILRHLGALEGSVVVIANAETYSTTRIAGLAANALSSVLQREVSSVAGQQLLNDPDVTLVIDGATEVPAQVRTDIRDELSAPLASESGAKILVIGRDIAGLRSVIPTSVRSSTHTLVGFSFEDRREAAQQHIDAKQASDDRYAESAHHVASQVEQALGEAAGNPMLFNMALRLLGGGTPFTDRASLYSGTVALLAERGGATEIDLSATALGCVFAVLLDDGRRFASPYEWSRLVNEATASLDASGLHISAAAVRDAATRSGLMVPIGYTQTQAPLHDSYADYLAGLAHSREATPLPLTPVSNDQQRLLFAAEIGGVTDELATLTAQHLPFLTVKMARHDRRAFTEDAPRVISHLYGLLAPPHETRSVSVARHGARVVITLLDGEPRWLAQVPTLGESNPSAVLAAEEGPLAAAVKMWRVTLLGNRAGGPWLSPPRASGPDQARVLLLEHAAAVQRQIATLLELTAPPSGRSALESAIGPTGMTAHIHRTNEAAHGFGWPVTYRATDDVSVEIAPDDQVPDYPEYGTGAVDHLVRQSPAVTAFERVSAAINSLSEPHWL